MNDEDQGTSEHMHYPLLIFNYSSKLSSMCFHRDNTSMRTGRLTRDAHSVVARIHKYTCTVTSMFSRLTCVAKTKSSSHLNSSETWSKFLQLLFFTFFSENTEWHAISILTDKFFSQNRTTHWMWSHQQMWKQINPSVLWFGIHCSVGRKSHPDT